MIPKGVRISRSDLGPKVGNTRLVTAFTRYIYEASSGDTPNLLVKRTASGWVRYVYGVGLLHQYSSTGERRYYHCDDSANVVAVTRHSPPDVCDRMDYTPYGQLRHRSVPSSPAGLTPTDTPFLFAGMTGVVTDTDGLLYMNARYYSPVLGRFLSADPKGFDGGDNWHAYASGNPLPFVDPSGYGPSATRELLQLGISVWV